MVNYASSKEGADWVVSEIAERGGKAFAAQGDVSKPDDVKQLFEDVVREFSSSVRSMDGWSGSVCSMPGTCEPCSGNKNATLISISALLSCKGRFRPVQASSAFFVQLDYFSSCPSLGMDSECLILA